METVSVPDILMQGNLASNFGGVTVCDYQALASTVNSRVIVKQFLICFLVEGQKDVHLSDVTITIRRQEGLIVPSGNCLMSERLSGSDRYRSVLIFLDEEEIHRIILKYAADIKPRTVARTQSSSGYFFKQDEYLNLLTSSLLCLQKGHVSSKSRLMSLKIEEFFLYLSQKDPVFLTFLSKTVNNKNDVVFKNVVEMNIHNHLNLSEIAFLCNMSLSTFKRHFKKIYGVPPSNWFRQRRMRDALRILESSAEVKQNDIFAEIGYHSQSGFLTAFKAKFGLTPRQFKKAVQRPQGS